MNAIPRKLTADAGEIERFVNTLFRYADADTFVSLRAFDQFDDSKPPVFIKPYRINENGLRPIIKAATHWAQHAADSAMPVVFAPPVATLTNDKHAGAADLANGIALSVDLDANPAAGRARLEGLLGPATVVVASGSQWTDPGTNEVKPKVHLHWRLSEATADAADHALLRQARYLAAVLVGGDKTAASPVHPLRWPGSWNVKRAPRMARMVT